MTPQVQKNQLSLSDIIIIIIIITKHFKKQKNYKGLQVSYVIGQNIFMS